MRKLRHVPTIGLGLSLVALLVMTARDYSTMSAALVAACALLFAAAWWAAQRLLGVRNACVLVALGLGMGWFAEQMGSSRGWFFGRYSYTNVLGPRLGDVPLAIPLMWFALCLVGYVLSNLLLWRKPVVPSQGLPAKVLTAALAAMLVTAFDLGADPYFVFVLKAWVMHKKDGGWFGETMQGFAGWMLIAFLIVLIFQYLAKPRLAEQSPSTLAVAAAIPLVIYTSAIVFQMLFGQPIETRAVAFFAMGIPSLIAIVAWWRWRKEPLCL
jgi:uncharacterized membrane protein